jgi:Chaperone of endosialidase
LELIQSPSKHSSIHREETIMNQARDFRNIVLGAIITASGLSAFAAINLTTFTPNTPIKSSEVNANFSSLQASVEALEAPVGVSRLATTGTAADGKVLKLQAGSLAWSDDLTGGTGGTAYSAGTGLALTGTTFSVALPLNLSSSSGSPLLAVNNATGNGISGISSGGSIGLLGRSSARGVVGTQGDLAMPCAGTYAVGGCATDGRGVQGVSDAGIGVIGISNARGVIGTQGVISCAGAYAVGGCATSNIGVQGISQSGTAAYFQGGSGGSGACAFNGGAGWACTSDRNKKENFKAVNAQAVLEKLAAMPVTRWNMKGDRNKTLHVGPVAQDFKAAFGLGENDTTINSADAQGVAFAAIKGIYEKNRTLEHQVKTLEARLQTLEKAMRSR